MTETNRRTFLKTAAIGSAVELHGQTRAQPKPEEGSRLDPRMVVAVGLAVLPVSALDKDGVERIVSRFLSWVEGFQPVAELDHPYLSSEEIPYGPPDPVPGWASQLEALEAEAQKRYGVSFLELPVQRTQRLIKGQIESGPGDSLGSSGYIRFPTPARASSLAVGLLAYFYKSSEANDLCHQAQIGQQTCRDLESGPRPPVPLEKGGGRGQGN